MRALDRRVIQWVDFLCQRRFRQLNPDLPSEVRTDEYVAAYVRPFGNSTHYLGYLVQLLSNNAPITFEEIRHAINLEHDRVLRERRVATVRHAMETGAALAPRLDILATDALGGTSFEELLAPALHRNGISRERTPTSGDQGADLIAERLGERVAVQAKCYSGRVSNGAVQETVAAMAFYQRRSAIVVTNNFFTRSAAELAAANRVELRDRTNLSTPLDAYL